MAFWKRDRASRADRAIGAQGRAPDPRKVFKANVEAQRRAIFEDMERREQSVQSAASAALSRLEARGFPGAVQRADPKRKVRAAWHLGEALANRQHGETAVTDYYLFSTGEVVDERGGSILACRDIKRIVARLNRLG